ncbi:hypothetical protein GCM10027451_02960 [Geodermatophilus aquaeductus]|uniref:Uncharacterized protein n=1 Tax=Geodermatophilus aquaeductus TaxID=1564161 RepID=A0A521CII9_9ACTN|nr:hypothetical protein [Geodermatophilus aquaeductus]SMO58510.1 hypothetical protein SAMN06273567_102379 [Geodermatophilus aquaeductus]
MGKVTLGLGFGIGYVLGARAGKDRYQQIVQSAQGLLGRPEVQQTISKARDAAPAPLQSGIDKLTEAASGGQGSSGGQSGGGQGSGSGRHSGGTGGTGAAAGVAGVGTGIPDTEALAAEAAVVEELDVVVTPPTPAAGTGGTAGANGAVPDPLIPPAKSGE